MSRRPVHALASGRPVALQFAPLNKDLSVQQGPIGAKVTGAIISRLRGWPRLDIQLLRSSEGAKMRYRLLGGTGLKVSVLTLGTMTFGGVGDFRQVGSTTVDQARRLLDLCADVGINLVDTANIYSGGTAEEILGQALRGRRDQFIVATKVGMRMGAGPNDLGSSKYHIVQQCDASLKRLQTGHIDLYQLHSWDSQTPMDETLGALADLQRAGKVRYIGCSNFSAWHLSKAVTASVQLGLPRFASHQIYYSLQAREAEYELVPMATDQNMGVLVWSPLAGGLLSGKYRRDIGTPEGSRRAFGWTDPPVTNESQLFDIVDVLLDIAASRQVSAARVALAYLLGKPAVTSLVIGARNEEQLLDNLGAGELELDAGEMARLDNVSAPALLYPYWHQVQSAGNLASRAVMTT